MAAEPERKLSRNGEVLLQLLRKVAPIGHIGNIHLRDLLEDMNEKWPEEVYWEVVNELQQANLIETGRGRGGSIWLKQASTAPQEYLAKDLGIVEEESQLYAPFSKWLDKNWGQEVRDIGVRSKVPRKFRCVNTSPASDEIPTRLGTVSSLIGRPYLY